MSYPSVVVFLDSSPASGSRLDFALRFAAHHNAHLTGIHMSTSPLLAFDPYGQNAAASIEWEEQVQLKQRESKEYFTQQAKNTDINFDWACYRETDMHQVLARARVADICVAGQAPNGSNDIEISRNFFSQFAINIGKPVLFIPPEKHFSCELKNVVVAWDGSREAARAISDAMPLLKAARIVSVISVISKKHHTDDLPDVDIAAFLARHKVKVEIDKIEKISSEAADFILSRVDLKCADLLVMGAFGHTRFSEFILGGVTRSVLQKMIVPVLMSH